MSKIKLRLGISPCPNDTWIFAALVQGRFAECPFEFETHFADVQSLNEKALAGDFDVLKVSFGTWLELENHVLLRCGGAMGFGCGPLLLSRNNQFDAHIPISLPGRGTTAKLLFDFWAKHQGYENLDLRYDYFDHIYRGLVSGETQQGVAIHECRFIWQKDGLKRVEDLGAFWESQTKAPIPLGGIILHQSQSSLASELEFWIRKSITWSQENSREILPWIQFHAQIEEMDVVLSHIRTYVNDFSVDIGAHGDLALQNLRTMVQKA